MSFEVYFCPFFILDRKILAQHFLAQFLLTEIYFSYPLKIHLQQS